MHTRVPDGVLATDRPFQDEVSAAVADIALRRAVIEQAKGMLMLVYAIDAATAFVLMRHVSQQHNVKLRCVAEQIIVDFTALPAVAAARGEYDRALFSVHERVVHVV